MSAQTTPARNPAAVCHTGRSAPIGERPSEAYTSSRSPPPQPRSPIELSTPDAPATTTSASTAVQPCPWITDPMVRPTAPPSTPDAATRLARVRYVPPVSDIAPSRPPIAGSTPSVPLPTANAADSGTQIASAVRTISGHGSGAGFGRTTSTSQSGTTSSRTAEARVMISPGLLFTTGIIAGRRPAPANSFFIIQNGPWYHP